MVIPSWRLDNFLAMEVAMVEIGEGDSGGSEWGEGRDEDSTSPHDTIAYIAWSNSVCGRHRVIGGYLPREERGSPNTPAAQRSCPAGCSGTPEPGKASALPQLEQSRNRPRSWSATPSLCNEREHHQSSGPG